MTWTAPMTWVDGNALTAAQMNTYVRDNSLETAPAKATAIGHLFVTTGANGIRESIPTLAIIATSETTTSTSYTDLASPGPEVEPITGQRALVFLTSRCVNSGAGGRCAISYDVNGSGSSDGSAWISESGLANGMYRGTCFDVATSLTGGQNMFTMKYRVTANTGTFVNRILYVIPL